jgi:hypothetical protein
MGEWRYSIIIFNLGAGWRLVVSFISLPLCPRGNIPGTHCIGGCVGIRAGLNVMEKRNISGLYRESNLNSSAIELIS